MHRVVSSLLVVLLPFLLSPALAETATAGLQGEVFLADTQTPLTGARIHLADPGTGDAFVSQPTSADGSFVVENLPEAAYRIGVEIDSKLYIVPTPVRLSPGSSRSVQLAVDTGGKPSLAPAGVWDDPTYAGLIIAGSAVALGLLLENAFDDDEPVISPTDD